MPLCSNRLRTTSLFVPAVCVLLGAQEADLAERLFRSGERAYAAKSHAEALDTWSQLLNQAPASPFAPQALLRMARHQLEVEKKPDAALPLLERVKTEYIKTPWAAEALLLRGSHLASRAQKPADLREAVGEFNRVVDLFPDHPALIRARYQLGLAAWAQGQGLRALQQFSEVMRLDPASPVALQAQLQAAEVLDFIGDLQGCLRLLQGLRNRAPQSLEAEEAAWRIGVRVKHRLQKPAFRSEGPWPTGKVKWLKTPVLMTQGPGGELYLYQEDLAQVCQIKGAEAVPVTSPLKDGRALAMGPGGWPWVITRASAQREGASALNLPPGLSPSGACFDVWGHLWIADAKAGALTVLAPDGSVRSLASPAASALAPLPGGGAVLASDANRSLLFLDPSGQPRLTVPYGKGLPQPFKAILALATDPLGHVAALVEGDFDGVVLWGPDGSLLRQATFKALGIAGKFRSLALDRQGGLLLADRSNDLLIRLS